MDIQSGNVTTLTPGHSSAIGNTITNFSRIQRTYAAGVAFEGMSNYVANNSISHAPHTAITYLDLSGNDLGGDEGIALLLEALPKFSYSFHVGTGGAARLLLVLPRYNIQVDAGGAAAIYFLCGYNLHIHAEAATGIWDSST